MWKNATVVTCGCLLACLAGCGPEGTEVALPDTGVASMSLSGVEGGEELIHRLCPGPDVKNDFWQAVAVLRPRAGEEAAPVACVAVSDECLGRVAEGPGVGEILGQAGAKGVKVLRSHMKVRIEEGRLVTIAVGGCPREQDARTLARQIAATCLEFIAREDSQRRRAHLAVLQQEIGVLRGKCDAFEKSMLEVRMESAVPQLNERRALVNQRQQEMQARMVQLDVRADECSRGLQAIKMAAETKDFSAIPEIEARVAAGEEVKAVQGALARVRLEKAEASVAEGTKEKGEALDKRLAALEALLGQACQRVREQAARDREGALSAELASARSERLKLEGLYRADLATSRDLVDRLTQLARGQKQVDDLERAIVKLEEQARDIALADKREDFRVELVGVYGLSRAGRKPLPLREPAPGK